MSQSTPFRYASYKIYFDFVIVLKCYVRFALVKIQKGNCKLIRVLKLKHLALKVSVEVKV